MNDRTAKNQQALKKDQQERVMRQTFSGLVAAFAVVTLGAAPAMACGGGGGLFSSPCSPCQTYVSPCGQSYAGGYGYAGYGHYQRLAVPSPQYYWVNQGPVYDGPGQFAPRPYYRERTVVGWHGHYGYTGGPYANPINHYRSGGVAWRGPAITSYRWHHRARPAHLRYGYRAHSGYRYGGVAWRGPAITSYRWHHRARPAHLRYGYRAHSSYCYAARPSVRYGHSHGVRSSVRYGYAPRHGHAIHRNAQRAMSPHVNRAPRFRDSGSYSYRSGFQHGSRAHRH
jgi:hypothetical protein